MPLAQLADGGRLVIPVGPPGFQRLIALDRARRRILETTGEGVRVRSADRTTRLVGGSLIPGGPVAVEPVQKCDNCRVSDVVWRMCMIRVLFGCSVV